MASQSWLGKTIGGRYQIETLLGQGGMSAVYRALDPNLRRTVAIKLIHPHLSTDPNFVGRFKEEAAAVARLRHPNIVQVHDFNVDGETYYMVMEYLVGETLQARLTRLNATGRVLSYSEAINICLQICDAAGYAHNHEIIHRDIKPANIMLGVNGQAILMDFGIVKIIGGEYHTSTGATIGTAMYMSPEQIRGERADDRSDIYSLGVTLYEMLSGHPPYQADSAVTLMMMVMNDPLPDLRGVRADIPDGLLSVIDRALAKDKTRRFQSMAEMAAALKVVLGKLENLPPLSTIIESNHVEPSETEESLVAENKIDGLLLPQMQRTESQSDVQPESVSSVQSSRTIEAILPATNLEANVTEESASPPEISITPKPQKASRMGLQRFIIPAVGVILLLAVFIGGYFYFASKRPPNLQLTPITYSSILINADTAKSVVSLGKWSTNSYVVDMAISPDAKLLVTANNRDWVRSSQYRFYAGLWQLDPGVLTTYLTGQSQWVSGVAFSSNGQFIATTSEDKSLYLWQVPSGILERKIEASFGSLSGVDFSSNNLLLAASSLDGYVGLWQIDNGNLLRTMQKQEFGIEDVEFSPNGSFLAAASDDGTILLWNVSDGSLAMTLTGHTAAVYKVTFSPDGTLLASASADHNIGLWSIGDGKLIRLIQGHADPVKDITFSPDGSLLASGSEDGTLRLWQVPDGSQLNIQSEEEGILSLAFSPNGYYLVSGGSNGTIHFWGISPAIPLQVISTPASP
jgi:eukaryotic-like serine/threonine-protein kinase